MDSVDVGWRTIPVNETPPARNSVPPVGLIYANADPACNYKISSRAWSLHLAEVTRGAEIKPTKNLPLPPSPSPPTRAVLVEEQSPCASFIT